MDCEKLSPDALKIFEEIKTYYPLNPWATPQWKEEGLVYDNGWHDLRKAEDRDRLIKKFEHIVGHVIIISARSRKDRNQKLTKSVFNFRAEKRWIEVAVLLYELDFQIETMDLVNS